MKRIISLALVALFVAAMLVACGDSSGGDAAANPVGKYYIKTLDGKSIEDSIKDELKDSGMSMEDYLKIMNITSISESITLELKADGTAIMSAMGVDADGTWKQDGSTISITAEGETQDFKISGSEISGTIDDTSYVFEKK